jgi:PPOX class probable F420-dependent enzyme
MAYDVPRTDLRALSDLPFHAVGDQAPFTPAGLERFVAAARVAVLGYVRRDGRPHQVPVWYTYRDGRFVMSTATGAPKHRALVRDPRVSLTIQDEAPPYRAVVMEGTVELAPIEAGQDPTEGMAVRYFGRIAAAEYDRMTAETYAASGLTAITFTPEVVRGFDNTRGIGRAALAFLRIRRFVPVPRRWL